MLNQSRVFKRYIFINNFSVCQCNRCRSLSSKTDCCKPDLQIKGTTVVKRTLNENKPINYDPYRIKGPTIVVPPLPPSKAKPMIECRSQKGPCAAQPAPVLPPPVPPPKKPFPWIYVWPWILFFTTMGAIYRYMLWKEEEQRSGVNKPVWRPRLAIRRPLSEKDLPDCVQYLIIGAGAAGWAAYTSIMQHHPTAKVFIITNEDNMPYHRMPISKFMWWNKEAPDPINMNYVSDGKMQTMLFAKCSQFLDPVKFVRREEGPAVSIASGWNVLRVDPDEHVVYVKTIFGERPIYYERCLLATGSRPKTLNIFKIAPRDVKERVCTLRTVRDLEIAYRKVKASKHVTIIGGGNLGSELAWHLGKMNKLLKEDSPNEDTPELVHVIKNKGILSGLLPQYLGEWAAEKIKAEGVRLVTQAQVYDAFMTKDKRVQLTLSNGESLITDYVLVAVGAEPRTEIAETSNLELDPVNGGFLVNTELEARKHLFVAGDAASVYTEWKDTRMRFEHLGNAFETGEIAGANMTGYWTPANLESHYRFTLGEVIQMEVIGEAGACMPTIGLFKQCEDDEMPPTPMNVESTGDRPCYKKTPEYKSRYKHGLIFYLRDEQVVGILFWNIPPVPDRVGVVQEMLRARPTYKDIDMLAELLGFKTTECVRKKETIKKSDETMEECPRLTNVKQW